MNNPFIRKLEHGAALTDDDRRLLATVGGRPQTVPARKDLIAEGDRPRNVHLVMRGYACRYKLLDDGRRQIMALFVPGDLCDLHVQILGEMDHGISTLTEAQVVEIPPDVIQQLIAQPRINRALWWASLVDEGTLREWLVSMGQRDAPQQMAHVFCEIQKRLRAVGLGEADGFDLPLTQNDLADVLGITPVHVNRTLKTLRAEGLVWMEGRRLVIPDIRALERFAGFDPNYLHLNDTARTAVGGIAEATLERSG